MVDAASLVRQSLDVEHRNMMYDTDPFIALGQFKEVAFRACTKARQTILTNTPTALGAKLLVACAAPWVQKQPHHH